MRITFSTTEISEANKQDFEKKNTVKSQKGMAAYGAYFAGESWNHQVMDIGKNKEKKKSLTEVQQEAGNIDTQVMQDYQTLMSNTMSEEDYAKLQEEGFDLKSIDPEAAVTILDKIKAELARSGQNIIGYTDTLDASTLEAALGSKTLANAVQKSFQEADIPLTQENLDALKSAWDMAAQLNVPTDGNYYYLADNGMEGEIWNFYLAQSSGVQNSMTNAPRYYADEIPGYYMQATDWQGQEISQEQLDGLLTQLGLEQNEENREMASWILQKGLPLTQETINHLKDLKQVEFPITEEAFAKAAAIAVADGKEPIHASLTKEENIYETAAKVLDYYLQPEENLINAEDLTARRQLEEIRLRMTAEVNVKLLKSGFSIDTAPMEELVEALKQAEKDIAGKYFPNDALAVEKYQIYNKTNEAVKELPNLPAQILANVFVSETKGIDFTQNTDTTDTIDMPEIPNTQGAESTNSTNSTDSKNSADNTNIINGAENWRAGETKDTSLLNEQGVSSTNKTETARTVDVNVTAESADISETQKLWNTEKVPDSFLAFYEEGKALKETYQKAQTSYEALMTAPRADMGDNIQKAFANVDDILQDLGLELTEENRKAVRILGYNRMDISLENIERVQQADSQVRTIMEKMTPAVTLKMIRDGINPLKETLPALQEYLDNQQQNAEETMESYSKFLYRLEQQNDISMQERESYIGIYRLLHQIESSDGAVIGALVNSQASLNFSNLLSAVRTSKSKQIDAKITDSFGTLKELVQKGESITEQIAKGFAAEIKESLTEAVSSEEADRLYQQRELEQLRQAAHVDTESVEMLKRGEIPASAGNLLAAQALVHDDKSPFKQLQSKEKELNSQPLFTDKEIAEIEESFQKVLSVQTEQTEKKLSNLWTNLDNKEVFQQEYEQTMDEASQTVKELCINRTDNSIDVKELQMIHKQLSVATSLAQAEEYILPMYIGEEPVKVHLTLKKGEAEKGNVKISVDFSEGEQAEAELWVKDNTVSGLITGNSADMVMKMQKASDIFCDLLQSNQYNDLKVEKIPVVKKGNSAGNVLGTGSVRTLFSQTQNRTSQTQETENKTIDNRQLYQIAKVFLQSVGDY